ncbi:hypothetical protein FRB98_005907, partial [Tulasnella sp. 332]
QSITYSHQASHHQAQQYQQQPPWGGSIDDHQQPQTPESDMQALHVPLSPPLTTTHSNRSTGSSSGSRIGHNGPPSPVVPTHYPVQKCLLWEAIFHPRFIGMEGKFGNWQFAGLYTNHILFSEVVKTKKGGTAPGRRVLVYDVNAQTHHTVSVTYDTAGLGPDGRYLLYREGDEMHMYEIDKKRKVKAANLRNLSKWTYNALGFCMVDSSGKFWRWAFKDSLPPALVFRLVDRAPRGNLKCLTTRDGAWNAIVATDHERTRGNVHCYPTDNDEARIYPGVLAAFTQTKAEDVDGVITFVAIVNVTTDELSFSMTQLGALAHNTIKRVETKMPISAVGGSPSAMFIDHKLKVAVVLAAPPKAEPDPSQEAPAYLTFTALIFDLLTGTFLMKQDVVKTKGDSWVVDDTGIFRETFGRDEVVVVQRLNVIRDALPKRTAVADQSARHMRPREGSIGQPGGGGSGAAGAVVGSRMLPTMPAPPGSIAARNPSRRPTASYEDGRTWPQPDGANYRDRGF